MYNRRVQIDNDIASNRYYDKGSVGDLGRYLFPEGRIRNFLVSGGNAQDRLGTVAGVLELLTGRAPVIVLHGGDPYMEASVSAVWSRLPQAQRRPFGMANMTYRIFEPFLGMSEMQVVSCLRVLAGKLGYTPLPQFEKVIRAHIRILKELKIPVSLSGFFYLCGFTDLGEFRENICSLPCGRDTGNLIWADLGADADSSQLDLFRAVISNLANDAVQSGWNPDGAVGNCNCLLAIRSAATFLLAVNPNYSALLLAYLSEELKAAGMAQYFLLLDGIPVSEEFSDMLFRSGEYLHCGLISENATECFSGDEKRMQRFSENLSCFVFMKQKTAGTAKALAEICGQYDRVRVEESTGTGRGFFNILPQAAHNDLRYSTDNTYRVMPEEITALAEGQAVVFEAEYDRVIFFN